MTSLQILDPLQEGIFFKHLEQTKSTETDPKQPTQSILENPHTDFGNQNIENETQNITNHNTQAVEISKEHNIGNQENRHANRTRKQRKRNRNEKRRGCHKQDSQVGLEQPLMQKN